MIVKKKVTKALIAASFLICIIAIVTPVIATNSNRVFFMAIGDDLDIPGAKNIIIGKIESDGGSEPRSAQVFFYSKIYDDSGEKVYTMMGMLKDGYLINESFSFFCPLYKVWFINVWQVMGMGTFRTSDTDITVYFRDLLTITMPNTEGKFVSAPIVMLISHTAEYRNGDPITGPIGPVLPWEQGRWVLAAVVWIYPGIGPIPVGPLSNLKISIGI